MQYILPRLGSNLFPISLDGGRLRRGTSSFKFENMLLEEGFKYLLKTKRAGSILMIHQASFWLPKLKALKSNLKVWNKKVFNKTKIRNAMALNQVAFLEF